MAMQIMILIGCLFLINGYSSLILESTFNTDEIGAYRNYVLITSSIKSDLNNLNEENSTEIAYELNKHSFPMFNTGTGINLVEYLQERLYEEEIEAFRNDKSLIDAAIIEYHKYLELTKNWINTDKDNKYEYIPSKIIDVVWHWHILQTYEYYLMCNKQLNGSFLHHRPYFGKEKQSKIYKLRINKYKKTLKDYFNYFGYYAPDIIWGKHKHSIGSCEEMHQCDSRMMFDVGSCEEMHQCDSRMMFDVGSCEEMHQCDSRMVLDVGNCDEMHACDSRMILDVGNCDEMHACDSKITL